jgi:hypothetical protein
MEYVSPIDPRVAEPLERDDRRVVLLDITKRRSAEFLDRIEQHLQRRGAQTVRIAKEIFSRPASTDVIERVAIHGDLVVEGLGD